MMSQVPPSSTVNRSKPVRFVALKRATIRGKKIWGRKRPALVATQGNLLGVKVLAAKGSDQQGAKILLTPLKEVFPRIKLVWGDSHYGGTFIEWLKTHLGWTVQTVKALTVPKRGLLVPEGTEVEWDKLFPPGCPSAAQNAAHRAPLCLHHPPASAPSRPSWL